MCVCQKDKVAHLGVYMAMFFEMRLRAGKMVGPIIGVCSIVYFGFHVVQGDRGLLTYWHLKTMIADTQQYVDATRAQRQKLEKQVRLLRPDSLDPDMLEERSRIMLNFGYKNDVVIFYEAEVTQ